MKRFITLSCSKNKQPLSETDTDSSPKAKHGRPKVTQVLARYPPLRDTRDDDVTITRNMNLIEKELGKERPRKEVLLSLVRQTYSARRQQVLTESEETTATALLHEFPVLKKIYVVCMHVCLHTPDSMHRYLSLQNAIVY